VLIRIKDTTLFGKLRYYVVGTLLESSCQNELTNIHYFFELVFDSKIEKGIIRENMDYKESSLWCNSLGNDRYKEKKLRNQLCDEYESSRENASFLLDKIRKDFPNLTVHDISHIDNMWHIASTITGKNYELNPLEGFVLGCAFLVHDAVLSYDAIGGLDELRSTYEWKDYYADYDSDSIIDEDIIKKECDFKTIRLLHANRAEDIFTHVFHREDGTSFYIIKDLSLREHLGDIIGKIAASHHWNIDDVETLDNQFGAPGGFPIEWSINPIKIACILRCADAAHIDGNRAPDSLLRSMRIEGISKDHWIAQNYLSQIMIDRDNPNRLVIKSNKSFEEKDFAAWNVAYDMVKLLNKELKDSCDLLYKSGTQLFQAKTVRGAESQEDLSLFIKTKGWKPCNAEIHTSNVEHLVETIGGEKLYGKNNKLEIVIRELIQNARDAIEARRKKDNNIEGKITININKDDAGTVWVEVIDNGIGMSISTIKECLLNFGSSFWKSDLMKREFPGLNSSGFKSIGEFGIGFYSIFMVAKDIFIETRKYDKGLEDAIQLKFINGFCLRPIVTNVRSRSIDYSTIVRFSLNEEVEKWEPKKLIKPNINKEEPFEVPYYSVVANMVAGLDVDVYYSDMNTKCRKIHQNINLLKVKSQEIASWLRDISYSEFRNTDIYNEYINDNYMRLERVYKDGKFKGILALNTLWGMKASYLGVETVGGLSTFNIPDNVGGYIGCLMAEPETARRNAIRSVFELKEWAFNQLVKLNEKKLELKDCIYLPYAISQYRIDISSVVVVICYKNGNNSPVYIRLDELIKHLNNKDESIVFVLSSFSVGMRVERYFDRDQNLNCTKEGEWLFVPVENSSFLSLDEDNSQGGYSIMDYINIIANKYGITTKRVIEENRFKNVFGESCSAMKVGFLSK